MEYWDAGCSCRKRTVISRMSAFSSFEEREVCARSDKRDTPVNPSASFLHPKALQSHSGLYHSIAQITNGSLDPHGAPGPRRPTRLAGRPDTLHFSFPRHSPPRPAAAILDP